MYVLFLCAHLTQLFNEVRNSVGSPLYHYLENMVEALAAIVCPIRTPGRDVLSQEMHNSVQPMQQQQSQTFYAESVTQSM